MPTGTMLSGTMHLVELCRVGTMLSGTMPIGTMHPVELCPVELCQLGAMLSGTLASATRNYALPNGTMPSSNYA